MKNQEKLRLNVLTLSSQKGCFLAAQMLQGEGYAFNFQNHINSGSLHTFDFLIIDENDPLLQSTTFPVSIKKIILTDTQKSPGSVFALSGQLSTFGQIEKAEYVPSYMLDFIVGIGLAIHLLQLKILKNSRSTNNQTKLSLVKLSEYYGAFNISAKQNGFLKNPLGKNLLDGGAPFYSLYQCKEGTLAVGNLQPKFYQQMVKGLGLSKDLDDFLRKNQFSIEKWDTIRKILKDAFILKTASEWQKIMSLYDTCVTEVSQKPRDKCKIQPAIYPLIKPKL